MRRDMHAQILERIDLLKRAFSAPVPSGYRDLGRRTDRIRARRCALG